VNIYYKPHRVIGVAQQNPLRVTRVVFKSLYGVAGVVKLLTKRVVRVIVG